jgi:hypothetical protein
MGVIMINRFNTLFKAGVGCVGCVAMIGLAQAAPVQLTANSTVKGDTSWQDIKGTSYTFNDANHNGQLNVGETATFTVDMHKTFWGVHDFDALKFWIDSPSSTNLATNQFRWDFDATTDNSSHSDFDHKPWTDGDQFFSFDYTFGTAGIFDLTASVMCSADLSGLTGKSQSALATDNDWSKWKESTHQTYKNNGWFLQGETEKYKLTVVQSPVPEPETYGMMLVGLGMLGFTARRRKDFSV